MYTDPIADYLTRIRNGNLAGLRIVEIPSSNLKKEITKILFDQGYILSYKFEETKNNQGKIIIALKYFNKINFHKLNAIRSFRFHHEIHHNRSTWRHNNCLCCN